MLEREGTWSTPDRARVLDPPGAPPGVLPAQLADHRFDLAVGLMRAAAGPVGPVSERGQASTLVTGEPTVECLARHPDAAGHLDHLPAVLHHREALLGTAVP